MRGDIGWKGLLIATHIAHGDGAQIQLLGLAENVSVPDQTRERERCIGKVYMKCPL